jgi:capsular exopolysaccharide synthesis family protein
MLVKRWAWLIILGIVICGGGTYIYSKLVRPVYQASAINVLTMSTSTSSPFDNTSSALAALPTFAQLFTNPVVLKPVAAQHPELTLSQLTNMITVKPQSNTQIIELDVQSTDPQLAMQLANEISRSFAQYVSAQFPSAAVQILPAQLPTDPVGPRPLSYAGLGALAGLGLALALIVIFEWIDDRLGSSEEAQEILGLDTLTLIPQLSKRVLRKNAKETPALAEGYRKLCAGLNAAQTLKPFKGIMVTSALSGEGKTTIAVNLASFLAMAGKQVLFVDADLRRPMLHHRFDLDNRRGLTSAFMERWTQFDQQLADRPTDIPTLRVLTAGVIPLNPAELLQSSLAQQLFGYFQKAPQFDYVVFDTPPVLPVADAQILASYIQTTVLVVDVSKTPRKALLRARSALKKTRTTIIGVVLNKTRWSDYDDIRQYLGDRRQPKMDISLAMPPSTPPLEIKDIVAADTAPLNGIGEDATVTAAFPRQQKDKGEKS